MIARGQTVISKTILGKGTKQPIVVVDSGILNHDKKLVGILGGVLNLYKPNLLGAIANRKNGKAGYYYIVTKDRVRIAHPDPSLILQTIPKGRTNLPLENAFQGFEGTQEGINYLGLEGLFTFKRMKSTDWIVASVIPSAEAFAPIADLFGLAGGLHFQGTCFVLVRPGEPRSMAVAPLGCAVSDPLSVLHPRQI